VTLNDVAVASGVSRATVSFVLNDDPHQSISPTTRERVRRVAAELGYVPHGIARALREGVSRIVVLNVDWGLEGNYSRSYIRGLDEELAAHDHVLLVRHGHSAAQATRQVYDAITPRAVLRIGEPYLSGPGPGGGGPDGTGADDAGPDDAGGGWRDGLAAHIRLQIGHLADRGHRRIALALHPGGSPLGLVHLRFARQAAEERGLDRPAAFEVPSPRAAGTESVLAFLGREPGVTAIAAFDDDAALRTLTALQDLGRRVPQDVAVIGFDDTEYGGLVTPALTTVHIDAEAHGRQAARAALGLDPAGPAAAPGRVLVRASA
jgi:DNA-binding LacI/PurR family transcriptional regulator